MLSPTGPSSKGKSAAVLDWLHTPEGLHVIVEGRDEPMRLALAPNGVLKAVPLPKDDGYDQDTVPTLLTPLQMSLGIDQA